MNETMTAEQAASKLTNIMHDDHYAWHPSILEAFRMAVDALKGAKGECISRAEAIDALSYCQTYLFDSVDKDKKVSMEDVIYALEQLPSAQPERVWHPVEKPPAHHKDVIVRGVEAIGNVTVHKVMQWDVDTWRPTDYAPSIMWTEWSEI